MLLAEPVAKAIYHGNDASPLNRCRMQKKNSTPERRSEPRTSRADYVRGSLCAGLRRANSVQSLLY